MAERRIAVPRVGEVAAAGTFRVIASMNPYDNIGTTRLSTSVHDRLCRLAVTYQDAAAERGIVALRAPQFDEARVDQALADLKPARYERLVADAVAVTRATRAHEDIRQGSSVRGAIDLTLIAGQLFELDPERGRGSAGFASDPDGRAAGERGETASGEWDGQAATGRGEQAVDGHGELAATERDAAVEQAYRDTVYDAMVVALSGRIFLDETVAATPEQVLRQIWEDHFILDPATAAPG